MNYHNKYKKDIFLSYLYLEGEKNWQRRKMETKKIAETTIELPGCAVTMTAIEEAVKKDMDAKEISGKEINVYINADQKAAYYTVDGEGADNYRIDLTSL